MIRTAHVDTTPLASALDTLLASTPARVDTLLDLHEREAKRVSHTMATVKRRIDQGADVAVNLAGHESLREELDGHETRADLLKGVFATRGGWNRAYKVVSSDGHIHRSTNCDTTYAGTVFAFLPQVSGVDEANIVSLAGERACTVCYPSAPVETREAPCLLFTEDEHAERDAKATRAREKEARAAAKAAKAITNPDGTPLRVHSVIGSIATEVGAQRAYVELTVDATSGYHERRAAGYGREAEVILTALAHKRGTTIERQRFELADKVIAKATRDDCPKAVVAAKQVKRHHLRKTAPTD